MTLITTKWLILPGVLLLVLVALYLFGKNSVHSEILIPAPAEQVWSVLTDTDSYTNWNPVLEVQEGNLEQGAKVKYQFRQNDDTTYEVLSTVKQIVENKILNQVGGTFGILTYDHRYMLEQTKQGTQVIIHEDYRGIAVPFWNPAAVGGAYERLNQALKERVSEVYPNE